jgi:murein DD-endopeptidase MepM/ murein hydrolase activator NlpD
VNEVYAWDSEVIPELTVQVRRPNGSLVLSAPGFAVDRSLSAPGSSAPQHWSAVLVAPDVDDTAGPVTVSVMADKTVLYQASSAIESVTFPSEDIPLGEAMSDLRSTPDPRKDREAARIWAIYKTFHPDYFAVDGFQLPVPEKTRVSARFGDQRRFLYTDGGMAKDYHRGIDFAVPVGTKVGAAGRGRVVLVADRELTGTTVVLEHAPGVYSVYFHLSRALVTVDQDVSAGETIALSGATGLVTGPHLHWEFRVDGVSVDPMPLVTHGLLDTNTVSRVVSSELNR